MTKRKIIVKIQTFETKIKGNYLLFGTHQSSIEGKKH